MALETFNPNYRERIQKTLKGQYFMDLIGFQITKIDIGRIAGALEMKEMHLQQNMFAHGGLIATVADIVSGLAAVSLVGPEDKVVTADLRISYLNPGIGQKLEAEGWVLKQGRKLNFCEAEVYMINNGERKMIAKSSATMATIYPEDRKPSQ